MWLLRDYEEHGEYNFVDLYVGQGDGTEWAAMMDEDKKDWLIEVYWQRILHINITWSLIPVFQKQDSDEFSTTFQWRQSCHCAVADPHGLQSQAELSLDCWGGSMLLQSVPTKKTIHHHRIVITITTTAIIIKITTIESNQIKFILHKIEVTRPIIIQQRN